MLANASASSSAAQDGNGTLLKGKAAFGPWQDKPGIRRVLTPRDLLPIGKSIPNFSEVAPMPAGVRPQVPPGFSVEMVASGIGSPRAIRLALNGDLFVADSASNTVRVLRVPAGSALPTQTKSFASVLYQPFGSRFYPLGPNAEWIYTANSDGIVRFPHRNGGVKASSKPEQILGRIGFIIGRATSCFLPTTNGCCSRAARDRLSRSTCFSSR